MAVTETVLVLRSTSRLEIGAAFGRIPGVDLATGRHLLDTCFDTPSTHPDESTL
jgi:hypothetical protein